MNAFLCGLEDRMRRKALDAGTAQPEFDVKTGID